MKYSIKQETFKRTSLTEVPTKNYLISVVLLSETKDICSLKDVYAKKKVMHSIRKSYFIKYFDAGLQSEFIRTLDDVAIDLLT